jgi:Domain of unknown function (DUF6894)
MPTKSIQHAGAAGGLGEMAESGVRTVLGYCRDTTELIYLLTYHRANLFVIVPQCWSLCPMPGRRASERWESSIMRRYFFDIYDGDDCVADDEGMELPDIASVQDEAAQSLSDIARNAISGKVTPSMGNMSIKVRDVGAAVLQPKYLFEIKRPNYLNWVAALRLHPALPALQSGATAFRHALGSQIKQDGYRLMVRGYGARIRCFTRGGHWAYRSLLRRLLIAGP